MRPRSLPAPALLALYALFAGVALGVYAPALHGPFVSDDFGTLVANPYVHELSWRNLLAILDPWGLPALYGANWAPLHLLAHALEWQLWGPSVTGYHVVNVLAHAGVATLLVAWLGSRGFGPLPCVLAGAFFLLHPANVEAVAWIFQLKTILALGLATAALGLHPRSGPAGLVLFALALLAKASAMFALPVAATLAWVHRDGSSGWRRHAPWLVGWALVLLLYAWPQFFSFERMGQTLEPLAEDPAARVRTLAAFGARYLVMAVSGYGVAAFQSPPVASSWLDGWWLLGLALALLLTARLVFALRAGREEAAGWVWAAAAWAPISQVFPFLYPVADRYLYFVLPGLLLGVLGWARSLAARSATGPVARARTRRAARAACVLALPLLAGFGAWSHARAHLWQSEEALLEDSARRFPDGLSAHLLRAQQAARRGDAEAAASHLAAAQARGFDSFGHLLQAPVWASIQDDPAFQQARAAVIRRWLRRNRTLPQPTQADLRKRAAAYRALGEDEKARDALEAALSRPGPFGPAIRRELEQVERALLEARVRARARARRAAEAPEAPPVSP